MFSQNAEERSAQIKGMCRNWYCIVLTDAVVLLAAKIEARDQHLRESWVKAMEARLVREELEKCQKSEGVNHYENCKWLSEKYLTMLKENKVTPTLYLTWCAGIRSHPPDRSKVTNRWMYNDGALDFAHYHYNTQTLQYRCSLPLEFQLCAAGRVTEANNYSILSMYKYTAF